MRGACLAIIFICLGGFSASGLAHRKLDVVLLLDTSASMLTSDPENLRKEAVRGFMALLEKDDRLAVFSFGDRVRRISDFVPMDDQTRLSLEARMLREMTPSGAYTNLYEPLEQALDLLRSRRGDALPMVVLFTDGHMDMGDPVLEQRLTHDLAETVLPRYREQGARIFSLAFSQESDRELLDAVSLQTGGFSQGARCPEDVWQAFGNLFENIKKPDRLPVKNGRFLVDSSVKEFKLLSGGLNPASVSVRSPSGRNTMTPASERGNPVLTVSNPEVGEWSISNGTEGDKVLVASDVAMDTDLPDYVAVSRLPRTVKAWAEQEGQAGGAPVVLSRMILGWWPEADSTVRRSLAMQRVGTQGVFTGQLPGLATGSFHLQLDVDGPSFHRTKHLALRVVSDSTPIPAVAAVSPTPKAKPLPTFAALPSAEPREEVRTAFFGLFRIEDERAWKALRIGIWSNLVLGTVIAALLYWRRRRRRGGKHP